MILAITLSALLNAMKLADGGAAAEKLGIKLNGYDWARDYAISDYNYDSLRAVIIARMGGSYIYVFQGERLIAKTVTPGEILTVELFDFGGDKHDEMITRQKTGWGTGIYTEEFIIYGVPRLSELWRATSYSYVAMSDRKEDWETEEGLIRPSDQHLLFISTKAIGGKRTRSRKFFKFDGKNFVPAREEP